MTRTPHLPWCRPRRWPAALPQPSVQSLDAFFPEGNRPDVLTKGPFRAPRFGRAWAPAALVAAAGPEPVAAAMGAGLAGAGPDAASLAAAREVMAGLRTARVGGAPGLP